MPPLVILFARSRLRLPRWYDRLIVWLIRTLSRSELIHIMVCYDGACLNPRRIGAQIGPSDPVIDHYPGLVRAFIIPTENAVDLDRHPLGVPEPVWPSILYWLTRGRSRPTCNCVACAVECLGQAGVIVPRRVTTPRHLHDWLMEAGYVFEELE